MSSRHISTFSSASIDLDVEGADGSRLDDDYDFGWSKATTSIPWNSRGPAAAPTTNNIRAPVGQSIRLHLDWAAKGFSDANRWSQAAKLIMSSSPLRFSLLKGLLLSSLLVGLIFFFELAFFPSQLYFGPGSHKEAGKGLVGSLESTFFLYPLVGGTYMLAAQWSTDVATAACSAQHGHNRGMSDFNLPVSTSSRKIILESYRIFLILNYTIICLILEKIPMIGRFLGFLFMSLIDGYYCFEMGWISRGWSVERRMRYVESRWAYFIAFGIPSTFVSFFHPSGLLNLGLFMLVFPFCIVLAMLSNPQPKNSPTSNNTSSTSSSSILSPVSPGSGLGGFSTLSLLAPARIPIFWPTVKLYRLVLKFFPPPNEGVMGSRGTRLGDAKGRFNSNSNGMGSYGNGTTSSAFEIGPNHQGLSQTSSGINPNSSGNLSTLGGGGIMNGNGNYTGSLGRKSAAQFLNQAWGGDAKAGIAMGINSSPNLGNSNSNGILSDQWGNNTNNSTPPLSNTSFAYQQPQSPSRPPINGPPRGWISPPPKGPARGKKQD